MKGWLVFTNIYTVPITTFRLGMLVALMKCSGNNSELLANYIGSAHANFYWNFSCKYSTVMLLHFVTSLYMVANFIISIIFCGLMGKCVIEIYMSAFNEFKFYLIIFSSMNGS